MGLKLRGPITHVAADGNVCDPSASRGEVGGDGVEAVVIWWWLSSPTDATSAPELARRTLY